MRNVFVRPVRLGDAGEILSESDPAFDAASPVLVRDPASGKPLDKDGENKPLDEFWSRRIRDRDVEEPLSPAARAVLAKKPIVRPASPVPAVDKQQ